MLKKAALSLFGLVVMLICINPPQAHAGIVVAIGPVYPHPVYVRPYQLLRRRLISLTGRILTLTAQSSFAPASDTRAITGLTTTGQDTGVRGDSNIASSLCAAPTGVANKFQLT